MNTTTLVIAYFAGLAFLCYLFYAGYKSIKDTDKKNAEKKLAHKES